MTMIRSNILAALLCSVISSSAAVTLPSLIGDHMVLQQQSDVVLWGTTAPGTEVHVNTSWTDTTLECKSGPDGKWRITITTPEAGYTRHTMTFDDGDTVKVSDVLIGEVWLASGQSNMEQTLRGFEGCPVEDAEEEIVNAASEQWVRMFNVPRTKAYEPQDSCGGSWLVPGIDTAPEFSATAWFFAKTISRALGVPVGVVNSSSGGSMVESWIDKETLDTYPDIPTDRAGIDNMAEWLRPMVLYNAMFHPIVNYRYKGIIWYQGCSNVGKHETYASRMADMVALWRRDLAQGDIPFYYAELAPFAHFDNPDGVEGALLREAQFNAQRLIPNSGMISTNDLAEPHEVYNVHPRGKRKVGQRLGYIALNRTYGKQQFICSGPEYHSLQINGDKAMVTFGNVPMRLCRNLDIKGFELAGEDRVFYPADDIHVDNSRNMVILSSGRVPRPVAVRYCFRNFQVGNLTGAYELPAVPFRTDNWQK